MRCILCYAYMDEVDMIQLHTLTVTAHANTDPNTENRTHLYVGIPHRRLE